MARWIWKRKCKTCYGKGWYLLAPYRDQRNGVKMTCATCGGAGHC